MPLKEVERRRGVETAVDHGPPQRDERQNDRGCRPVQRNDQPAQARRPTLGVQSSAASLEITSSTSRETSGKPEFMPNASRSMLVFAEKASRAEPPLISRCTATSTLSGRVRPRSVSSPVTRTVWSSTFSTELETKSIEGKRVASRKATERK